MDGYSISRQYKSAVRRDAAMISRTSAVSLIAV
jgi:hypothetical protein